MNNIISVYTEAKDVTEVAKKVIYNIQKQRKERRSIAMTILHGEVQSGKTIAVQTTCDEYKSTYKAMPLITLTYPSKHLWHQLEHDYKEVANPQKLHDLIWLLDNNRAELDSLLRKHPLLILEEGEFANGDGSRVQRLFSYIDSASNTAGPSFNLHLLIIGATNFSVSISNLFKQIEIETNHIKLQVGPNYFGPSQMLDNGNIIDLGDPKTGEFAINDGKFTKKFWEIFDNSFKGFKNGIGVVKVKFRDEDDNKSITLCNKIIKNFEKKHKDFIVFAAYDSSNGEDWIKNQIETAQREAQFNKVFLVIIEGLGAGVRLYQSLKNDDFIRFGYETSAVSSTTSQSLVGRFSGYYPKKPTFKLIVNQAAVEFYSDFHTMLDSGEMTVEGLGEYDNISTHYKQKVSERIYAPVKFISEGKVEELGLTKKLVTDSVTNPTKVGNQIREILCEDVSTIRYASHKSKKQFMKKWDFAKANKGNVVNILDIAYSYYATTNPNQYILLFDGDGNYIRYELLNTNVEKETKREVKNRSMWPVVFE